MSPTARQGSEDALPRALCMPPTPTTVLIIPKDRAGLRSRTGPPQVAWPWGKGQPSLSIPILGTPQGGLRDSCVKSSVNHDTRCSHARHTSLGTPQLGRNSTPPKNVDIKIKSSAPIAQASPESQTPTDAWQVAMVTILSLSLVSSLLRSSQLEGQPV